MCSNSDKKSNNNSLMSSGNDDNVRVACRFRPPNQREKNEGQADIVIDILDCNKQVKYRGKKTQSFTFDRAFSCTATQEQVFEHTGALLVDEVLQGINCTLFAYGQTGSGKTHTMEGQIGSLEMEGLIPRMIRKLFDSIQSMQDNVRYALRVSYVEIYNEKLKDLLDPSLTPKVRGGMDGRNIKVENSHEQYVSSPEQVFELLYAGHSNRSVAATKMNSASSRSHAVFMLYIEREESNGTKKKSKLLMVDLAGSEKVKKTAAKGALLEEAKNINQSLSTLGNVINALTKGHHHIPYRDSVLTRLLSDALGGNSKTMLIIAASPCLFNAEETLSTLRFGKRAKEIKNRIAVNEELSIEQYKARLNAAKLKIHHLEQENNTLKKKVREMMVISSKSSDKQIILKFETVVKNVDLNPTTNNNNNNNTKSSHSNSNTKGKKNKLSHSRNKSTLSSLTLDSIKNNKNKKQNKMSRSMSVQMNDESIMEINRIASDNNTYQQHHTYQVSDALEKEGEILRLQEKVNELKGELDASEAQQLKLHDEKTELDEGHQQIREENIELQAQLDQFKLNNEALHTKVDSLQTLLDDVKLRTTQRHQQFESKEKTYFQKCQRLQKEISQLKHQNKKLNITTLTNNQQSQSINYTQDIDDRKLDYGDLTEELSKLEQNANTIIDKEFVSSVKHERGLHKALKDRYKKLSEVLKCYKERDQTNYALRRAWTKHMTALEKVILQQQATTSRWKEQSKSHEEILKTEIQRLKDNIKHFQKFKLNTYRQSNDDHDHMQQTQQPQQPIIQQQQQQQQQIPHHQQQQQQQQQQQAQQQYIQHQAYQPTYIQSTYGGGARLANPVYIAPQTTYIQPIPMPQMRHNHTHYNLQ